jgi:hypothetical protein
VVVFIDDILIYS